MKANPEKMEPNPGEKEPIGSGRRFLMKRQQFTL
jgi:hypothetical protein